MSRLENTLQNADEAYALGSQNTMVNIAASGQQGITPDPQAIYANGNYVKQQMIALLVAEPTGFNYLPNPDKWTEALKALIEVEATSISGMNSTLTVDMEGRPVGAAGEQLEDVTNVTRAVSAPSFTWPEKYGKPITRFWDAYILNLLGDPGSKIPRIVTLTDEDIDLLPDVQGFAVMFIEPDPTLTKVVESWLSVNMKPRNGVANEGRREIASGGELLDASVEFSAFTTCGDAVTLKAQGLLDEMNRRGFNSNNNTKLPEEAITANVAKGSMGINSRLDSIGGAVSA